MYPNSVPAPDAAENAALPTAGLQVSTTTASPRRFLATTFTDPPPLRSLSFHFCFSAILMMFPSGKDPRTSHWIPVPFLRECTPRSLRYRVLAFSLATTITVRTSSPPRKHYSQPIAPFSALLIHSLSTSRLCPDSFNRIVRTRFR